MSSFVKKVKTVVNKVKTISNTGLDPYLEGKKNYELNDPVIEKKAKERYDMMVKNQCKNFVIEPIEYFRLTDERIPETSEMMCGHCDCGVTYKLRQDISKCKCWDE